MTMHFQAALSVPELAERATQMMDEACALARLASDLADFERTTGRKLFVSEGSEQSAPEEFQFRSETESEIEVENAAQDQYGEWVKVEGDSAGEALPPIEEMAAQPVSGQFEANAAAPTVAVQSEPAPHQFLGNKGPELVLAPRVAKVLPETVEARAPAQAAPRKAKGDDRPWGKLTLPERQIVKHLERLPKAFTPEDDLRLVELLTGGNKIDAAAAFLEVEPDVALTRWKSFLTEDVIGANGKPTIDGQQRLLNALRYRVEMGDA